MSTTRLKLYFKKPMLYQKGLNTTLSEPDVWPIALSCASWSVAVVILGYSISLFTTWLKNIWNAYLQLVVWYHQKGDYIRKQVFVTKYFCLWSFDFDRGSYDINALVMRVTFDYFESEAKLAQNSPKKLYFWWINFVILLQSYFLRF